MTQVLYIGHPLSHSHELTVARSGSQALSIAAQKVPDVIVLNACSLQSSGERICGRIKKNLPDIPLIHIHPGPEASSSADIVLIAPVAAEQIDTTIENVLNSRMEQIIECGPFRMNTHQRILHAHGKEIKLTPKQALLVEAFLRQPGETIERKTLMENVWQTDYMGDTRTLDVHIRWIRKIIENGHKKPRYLQTVRGVGYRLEIT